MARRTIEASEVSRKFPNLFDMKTESSRSQTVLLHRDAPAKPPAGEACNRCGVCCAAEPCPLAQLLFRQRRGGCPALSWEGEAYACGLVRSPDRYLSWLPRCAVRLFSRLALRSIAAGKGCDSHAELLP